jgi:hypothetical protein
VKQRRRGRRRRKQAAGLFFGRESWKQIERPERYRRLLSVRGDLSCGNRITVIAVVDFANPEL